MSNPVISFYSQNKLSAPSTKLFLDIYSGAKAAYSFRRLSSSYTGNCITVRRSSDNAVSDIGFLNDYIDISSLQSFIGSSSAYVTNFYDQSGNNFHLYATGSTTNEPEIAINGTIHSYSVAGKTNYAMKSMSPQGLVNNEIVIGTSGTANYIFAAKRDSTSTTDQILFDSSRDRSRILFYCTGGTTNLLNNLGQLMTLTDVSNNAFTGYFRARANDHKAEIKTTTQNISGTNTTIGFNTSLGFTIGNIRNTTFWNTFAWRGHMSEFIIYDNNQDSNLDNMKSNLQSYYNII